MTQRVSVIIATMNREKELLACLESLGRQSLLPHELVIVDDGDLDPGWIRAHVPPVAAFQYHRKSPPGLSASRNLGARAAAGDLLLFLDDDVVLEPEYVARIVEVFDQDPQGRVGAACGVILNRRPKPRLFRHWSRLFLMDLGRQGAILPWGFYTHVTALRDVMDVDWVPGGLSCFRREVFQRFQLSDFSHAGRPGGRHGLADVEFSWRVSRHYILKATPHARLRHYPSPRSRERSAETGYKQAMNHGFLFEEHAVASRANRACFLWAMTGLILGNLGSACFMPGRNEREARLLLALGNVRGFLAYWRERRGHGPRAMGTST